MQNLQQFVQDARNKGWDDEKIRQTLTSSGWQSLQIDAALNGLEVPMAPTTTQSVPTSAMSPSNHTAGAHGRPSISALQAALQHVLLWVFTFTSSIMFSVVSFALFARGDGSSESLLTYVVLELVTFIPFAFFYWQFLRQLKKQPDLQTGRVWSIITVVLHSIGLIGAVVSLILVLILVHDAYTVAGVVSSAMVAAMDALVVTAYVFANFAKHPVHSWRKRYLQLFPVALFVLIAVLAVIALLRVGPLKADDQTKKDLANTVTKIHDYAGAHQQLPDSLSSVNGTSSDVTYQRLSTNTYQVCADFRADHTAGYNSGRQIQTDDYVDSWTFDYAHKGNNCWKFSNSGLQVRPSVNLYQSYPFTQQD